MTALLVADIAHEEDVAPTSSRLDIFPGGATPSVFSAGVPFWVGYGFASDPAAPGLASVDDTSHFELDVDGRRVELRTDVRTAEGLEVRRADYAEFPSGLPAGWHELFGRWYVAGTLVLTNAVSVEFVER